MPFSYLQILYSFKCNWSHMLACFQATIVSCNFVSLCLCNCLMSMFTLSVCDVNKFFFYRNSPHFARGSSFTRFLHHPQRRATDGSTPLDKWSARRRELYLTTHNIHNRQTSIPPVGFEHAILAGERPETYALDRAATGTGDVNVGSVKISDRKSTISVWFRNTELHMATELMKLSSSS
jgi:hypothetical protein